MKNKGKCYKDFFGYFNALKTHGIIKKSWWTEKVYSITDTSGKILLKSTEAMANVKAGTTIFR